jgi:hypothetical protein
MEQPLMVVGGFLVASAGGSLAEARKFDPELTGGRSQCPLSGP